jgi:4-hydroxy-3-methylbut-2-enyl diphosphate reductase
MDAKWFEGVENVGITSGASTPEQLVEAVIRALHPVEVVTIEGVEEDVSFVLPKELR